MRRLHAHLLVLPVVALGWGAGASPPWRLRPDLSRLPALLGRLTDPLPEVRRASLEGVCTIARQYPTYSPRVRAIPRLVAALLDPDATNRRLVVQVLKATGAREKQVVQALVQGLDDSSVEVRKETLWALHKLGPAAASATARLTQMLEGSEGEQVLWVLGTVAPQHAAALFEKDLQHPTWKIRHRGTVRLGAVNPPTRIVIQALCKALRDPDRRVRAGAARSLAMRPDASTLPALRTALSDHDEAVRVQVVEALGSMVEVVEQVAPLVAGRIDDASPRVAQSAVRMLGALGGKSVLALPGLRRGLAHHEPAIRELTTQVIAGEVRGNAQDLLPDLLARLGDTHGTVRAGILGVLAMLAGQGALPASVLPRVRRLLLDHDGAVRVRASETLTRIAAADRTRAIHPDAAPAVQFLFLTLSHPRWEFRAAAVGALGELLRESRQAPAAVSRLTHDPHRAVRQAALEAVRRINTCCRIQP